MSHYRFARKAAAVISIIGWLHVVVFLFVIAISFFSPLHLAMLELGLPRFAIVIAVGAFLGLFGSVARAAFDIADGLDASRGDASPNNSSKPTPLRGAA